MTIIGQECYSRNSINCCDGTINWFYGTVRLLLNCPLKGGVSDSGEKFLLPGCQNLWGGNL